MNNTNLKKLQRRIMRRVYTIFAARVVGSPILLNVALFAVALTAFRELVWVKRVMETLAHTPVSAYPEFVFNSIMRGEVVTLAALGIMCFTALSLQKQIRSLRVPFLPRVTAHV